MRRSLPFVLAAALLAPAAQASAATPRVVALTPFTANVSAAVGVRPVAVGQVLGGADRFAPSLSGVRRLTLSHPMGPNLEQLAVLNPRIVLSAPIWRRGSARMRKLGISVLESDPQRVTHVPGQAARIGRAVGRANAGRRVARRIEREIHAATRGITRRPRVLLVLGVGRASFAMTARSWGGDVIQRAGGRLLGARLGGTFVAVSNEWILRANPQVIIAVPHGNADQLAGQARTLRANRTYRRTAAGRSGRIHLATGNSLLQAYDDVGRTILDVRRKFLRN